jgi:hypothetical protein
MPLFTNVLEDEFSEVVGHIPYSTIATLATIIDIKILWGKEV